MCRALAGLVSMGSSKERRCYASSNGLLLLAARTNEQARTMVIWGPGTASYLASRVRTGARRICIANLMIAAEALRARNGCHA